MPAVLLLLPTAVLVRVVAGGGGWLLRRTPESHRGRAPPAYAIALS